MSTTTKVAALGTLPALALGLAAVPAFAWTPAADTTTVNVANVNGAAVMNTVMLNSNTGDNTANGAKGGKGGAGGDSGSNAGNGGEGGNGGEAGNGGDAKNYGNGGWNDCWWECDDYETYGTNVAGDGGNGGTGSMGGHGGNTGDAGNGGHGGMGGMGGMIITGDAMSGSAISNDVNHNSTDITLEDCGCDRYNVWSKETWMKKSKWSEDYGHRHGSAYASDLEKTSSEYSKTAVPQEVSVNVANVNEAVVANAVAGGADTGKNVADAGKGGKGGYGGNSGSNAGDGADGGNGGEAGNGGDAKGSGDNFGGFGGNGGDAGMGGNGGHTGNGANAGHGANGGDGGTIATGKADVLSAIANVVNKNVTRVLRTTGN